MSETPIYDIAPDWGRTQDPAIRLEPTRQVRTAKPRRSDRTRAAANPVDRYPNPFPQHRTAQTIPETARDKEGRMADGDARRRSDNTRGVSVTRPVHSSLYRHDTTRLRGNQRPCSAATTEELIEALNTVIPSAHRQTHPTLPLTTAAGPDLPRAAPHRHCLTVNGAPLT